MGWKSVALAWQLYGFYFHLSILDLFLLTSVTPSILLSSVDFGLPLLLFKISEFGLGGCGAQLRAFLSVT